MRMFLRNIRWVLHSYKITRFSNHLQIQAFPRLVLHSYKITRFSNKRMWISSYGWVLHSYKITRFSNDDYIDLLKVMVLHSYKITRFSNHQIKKKDWLLSFTLLQNYKVLKLVFKFRSGSSQFYTLTKLQGSQTNMYAP